MKIIRLPEKVLLLTLICIFLINSFSVSYACHLCDVNDSLSYDCNECDDKDISSYRDLKESNINKFQKNNKVSLDNNSLKTSISNGKILASGENDRPVNLSQKEIIATAKLVKKVISKNGKLPNYVIISNYKISMPEFMYLLAKTIEYKSEKNNASICVKYGVKNPTNPLGVDLKGKISKKDFKNYSKRVANFIISKSIAPNYVSTPLGNMQYQTTIYSFIKILEKKNLPKSISIKIKNSNKINKFVPKYSRVVNKAVKPMNIKYKGESIDQYLIETKNCQVNDKLIKSLAENITSQYTTNYQKAEAIFNYVNKDLIYIFYYNTKYGAKNTISNKGGNCVDKSHLIIALCRSINIPARYVHGTCNFMSGNTYGHVWTQILVNNKWVVADPTHSEYNKFGLIGNWDTNSYTLKGIFNEIRF